MPTHVRPDPDVPTPPDAPDALRAAVHALVDALPVAALRALWRVLHVWSGMRGPTHG
jgi:hypothetical protein